MVCFYGFLKNLISVRAYTFHQRQEVFKFYLKMFATNHTNDVITVKYGLFS